MGPQHILYGKSHTKHAHQDPGFRERQREGSGRLQWLLLAFLNKIILVHLDKIGTNNILKCLFHIDLCIVDDCCICILYNSGYYF